MSDANLNISITLNDKITTALQGAGKALDDFHSNLRTMARETEQIGSNLSLLGAAITGPFALAFADFGKNSIEGSALMQDFGNTMDEIRDKLAQAVVPSFEQLTERLNRGLDAFNKLDPAMQKTILSTAYAAGTFLVMSGIFLIIIGHIEHFAAALSGLAAKFIPLIALNPELFIILGIFAALVAMTNTWNQAMVGLISLAELFVRIFGSGLLYIKIFFEEVIKKIEDGILNVVTLLAKIPGPSQKAFQGMIGSINELRRTTQDWIDKDISGISTQFQKIGHILVTGVGDWGKGFQNISAAAKQMIGDFSGLDQGLAHAKKTAEDYFKSLTSAQQKLKQANQEAITSLKQLAQLTNELSNQKVLTAKRETTEQVNLLREYESENEKASAGIKALQVDVAKSFQTNMSAALNGIITGTESAKQAFEALGQAMIQTVVNYIAQKLVAFVVEHTILAGTVAASTAAATAIAGAWASAAAAVSLATFGGNAPPAAAGMISTETLARALFATPRAFGGNDIVTKPTLFLAGENGPERATFTPLGRGNHGGGTGAPISIYIMNPSLASNQDITKVAQQLGFKLNQLRRTAGGI